MHANILMSLSICNGVLYVFFFGKMGWLECSVRQGGLSSPNLLNLYVDRLIGELSNANVSCSADGTFINNISYADEMVFSLCKLMSVMWRLMALSRYVQYEMMAFKAVTKFYSCVLEVCKSSWNTIPTIVA